MECFNRKALLWWLPLLLVEAATAPNLAAYYHYHQSPTSALLLTLSFSALLLAMTVLAGQEIGCLVTSLVILGGLLLFLAQGAATISESFLRAQEALPADRLSHFWGAGPQQWLVLSSVIWGGTINLVGAIYWVALSLSFRRIARRPVEAPTQFKSLEELFKGVSSREL